MKGFSVGLLLAPVLALSLYARDARTTANNEAQIRRLIDQWTKAFEARDLSEVMAIYAPGDQLIVYDVVPPLQYTGWDAYKRDFQRFFDQFEGPLQFEFHDLTVAAGPHLAFSYGLGRVSGRLRNGKKTEYWVRVTECYRKINGRWMIVHDHVSVPVDMATKKAELNLAP